MKGRATIGLVSAAAGLLACADLLDIGPVPDASDNGPATDAGDGGGVDAGPMCDPTAPFASVDPVTSVGGPNVEAVTLAPDAKMAFVCKYDATVARTALYLQTRNTDTEPFGQTTLLLDHACAATISADHQRFFYEFDISSDGGLASGDRSTFNVYQVDSPSGNALDILDAGTSSNNGLANTPFLTAGDTALYIRLNQGAAGPGLYRAPIPAFDGTTRLNGLSQFAAAPVVTADELVLYFSEGSDLAVAVRAKPTDDFSKPIPIVSSDAGTDSIRPALVSQDRCTVYYAVIQTTKAADGGSTYAAQTFVGHRTP